MGSPSPLPENQRLLLASSPTLFTKTEAKAAYRHVCSGKGQIEAQGMNTLSAWVPGFVIFWQSWGSHREAEAMSPSPELHRSRGLHWKMQFNPV